MYYLLFIRVSCIRSHLDFGDVVHGQLNNESFSGDLEKIQYNATFVIKGAFKCTSLEKLHKELGFEFLKSGRR